jgi:hypothetical protein
MGDSKAARTAAYWVDSKACRLVEHLVVSWVAWRAATKACYWAEQWVECSVEHLGQQKVGLRAALTVALMASLKVDSMEFHWAASTVGSKAANWVAMTAVRRADSKDYPSVVWTAAPSAATRASMMADLKADWTAAYLVALMAFQRAGCWDFLLVVPSAGSWADSTEPSRVVSTAVRMEIRWAASMADQMAVTKDLHSAGTKVASRADSKGL